MIDSFLCVYSFELMNSFWGGVFSLWEFAFVARIVDRLQGSVVSANAQGILLDQAHFLCSFL